MPDTCISCGSETTGHYHFTTDDVRPCCSDCAQSHAIMEFAGEYWVYEMFWDFTEYPPVGFFEGH